MQLETRAAHERTLRLPVPSLDPKAFLKLLQLDLAAHPPEAPVAHVWMGMNPVKPRAAQSGLFVPAAPEPVKLELTLARIKAIVGEGPSGVAGVDGYAPAGCVPDASRSPGTDGSVHAAQKRRLGTDSSVPGLPRFSGRRCAARVALTSGRPGFVAAEGIRGKVLDVAGPWRTSGDWWTADPWSRDEWDIALSDGGGVPPLLRAARLVCGRSYD